MPRALCKVMPTGMLSAGLASHTTACAFMLSKTLSAGIPEASGKKHRHCGLIALLIHSQKGEFQGQPKSR